MRRSKFTAFVILTAALWSLNASADAISTQVASAVGNFHVVASGKFYRGARPGDSGLAALAQAGIRTVIDLQGGDKILGIPTEAGESDSAIAHEGNVTKQDGMQFFSERMSAINPDIDDQDATISEVLKLIRDPRNQPVFIHCRHGSDRTGLIAALYRVLDQGCTADQAHREWMADGHAAVFFWMDNYFRARVQNDPRTQQTPAASCPLN